jgi:uridine kinase
MTSVANLNATDTVPDIRCLGQTAAERLRRASLPVGRQLFCQRGFWVVLAAKLALGSLFASYYLRDLFVPFLNYFVRSGFHNPWQWSAAHGVWNSFPYPPLMLWIMSAPRIVFAPFLSGGVDTVDFAHLLVARLPIAAFDVLTAYILACLYPDRISRVLRLYWYSPIVMYVCYWHGQLDVIPTALVLLSLYLLRQERLLLAMIVLGLSVGTKSHLWVCVPYILVYVCGIKGWKVGVKCAAVLLAIYAAVLAPYISDSAFRSIVFFSPEQARLVAAQVRLGSGDLAVLIAPGAIGFLWFRFAAYEKRNWDLLMLYLGILSSIFLLFAPPQPGYVLWLLPFLMHYFCRRPKIPMLPYVAFAASYLGFILLRADSDLFDAWKIVVPAIAALPNPYRMVAGFDPSLATLSDNFLFTVMEASLTGIVLYMYLMGVRGNVVYRMRTNPVMVGIAGDSGSGKDTLTELIIDAFGADEVTVVAGDDYHRWPRGHECWKDLTHLNAAANRIHEQQDHAFAMYSGESVWKQAYDHQTGYFTPQKEVSPNHIIILQGLHCLSTPEIRSLYDLKIFLDPEEELRYSWKLARDCRERGQSVEQVVAALESRSGDRSRFILPQRQYADLVVRWRRSTDGVSSPTLTLEVQALNSFGLTAFAERLALEPDLDVEHEPWLDATHQVLRITGHVRPGTLSRLVEIETAGGPWLRMSGALRGGLEGCLQVILFLCLRDKVRWRGQPIWPD